MDNKLNSKGILLKQARESKGITLDVVHENTKIPLDALRALEEGYSIRTITPFYQKGFLKMYAQYLELDVNEILRTYDYQQLNQSKSGDSYPPPLRPNFNQERVKEREDFKAAPAKPPVTPIILQAQNKVPIKSEALKEKKAVQDFSNPQPQLFQKAPPLPKEPPKEKISVERFDTFFTPEKIQLVGKIIGFLFVLLLVVKAFGWIGHKISSHKNQPKDKKVVVQSQSTKPLDVKGVQKSKEVKVTTPPPKVRTPVKVAEEKPVPVVVQPESLSQSTPTEAATMIVQASGEAIKKNVDLTVRAKKSSWLLVKADGVVVFQGTLKKGVAESWVAEKEIELSGKNISQLEFEVNGKMVGALSRKDMGAKIVVITKNGLSVKK